MPVNFLLKNLELALDDQHLIVGEKLFEAGKMTRLFESERNLWIAVVDGFETELQISPSRVKACSCECNVFLQDKMCGHVAAGLLGLRKHFTEKKPAQKKPKRKPTSYQRLSTSAILEQVGSDDLYAFVRKYAKHNRSFSLALRTRFASAVPMFDSREKYRQLFHEFGKTIQKKNAKISANGVKQLYATCQELLGQADDAIALEHFTEGVAIILTVIEMAPNNIRKIESDETPIVELTKSCFDRLNDLLAMPIPPDLRQEIWEFTQAEFSKYSYRANDLVTLFFGPMVVLADDGEKKKNLFDILVVEWNHRSLFSEKHATQLLSTILGLTEYKELSTLSKAFLSSIAESFESLQLTVQVALESGQLAIAKKLIANGLKNFSIPQNQFRLEELTLQLAKAEGDETIILHLAKKFYLATGDLAYFQSFKQFSQNDWETARQTVIDEVRKLPDPEQTTMLPALYEAENLQDELIDFLLKMGSLEMLMAYDHNFVKTGKKELVSVYRHLLKVYLNEHFGVKPTQKLLEIFAHLRKLDAHDVVDDLVAWVRKNYPRRMELAMELLTL